MNQEQTSNLSLTEEIDFAYLLNLMPPLHNEPEFAWLPELFSIIGHERLLLLCKFAGGETIKIPSIEQLSQSIEALQWFYDIHIQKTCKISECPESTRPLLQKVYDAYSSQFS